MRFKTYWFMVLGVLFVLTGCGTQTATTQTKEAGNDASPQKVVHIGYQLYGTSVILKSQGTLDKRLASLGYKVQWTQFPGGPQLLEALNAGSIDLGETGDAPPIFAQAAGAPLVYLGHEPASPEGEAILVPANSSIHSVKELKGKKIVLNKGSNVHYLLVSLLQKAGLKYSDVQPEFLAPADARAAFQQGSVDAWAIWDPYLAAAQTATHARILSDGKGAVTNYQFYLGSRTFAQNHPDVVQVYLDELQHTDALVKQDERKAAEFLSPQTGIAVDSLTTALGRRAYGVQPIDDGVIAAQQKIADTFLQLGLIPKAISVKEDVLSSTK